MVNTNLILKSKRKRNFSSNTKYEPANKKIKFKHPITLNDQCLISIFSFFPTNFENLKLFSSVNQHYKKTYRAYFLTDIKNKICSFSFDSFFNSLYWSKNHVFLNACDLIDNNQMLDCSKMLGDYIPLNKCFSEQNYQFSNTMEYMLFELEKDDSHVEPVQKQKTMVSNYNLLLEKLLNCLYDSCQYRLCIRISTSIINNYNPIAVYARKARCCCFQKLGYHKLFFHETIKCLLYCHEPVDISDCFHNFAVYYLKYNSISKSIAFFLKSSRISPSIQCVKHLDFVQLEYIEPKIKRLKETKDIVGYLNSEQTKEILHWENLLSICKEQKKEIIDFMCQNNMIKIDMNMSNFLSKPYDYLLSEKSRFSLLLNEKQERTLCEFSKSGKSFDVNKKKNHHHENEKHKWNESELKNIVKTYQNYLFQTDRKIFITTKNEKISRFIDENTKTCNPIVGHKIDLFDYNCNISSKVKFCLKLMEKIENENEKYPTYLTFQKNEQEVEQLKQSRKQFIKFGNVWIYDSFRNSRNLSNIINALK